MHRFERFDFEGPSGRLAARLDLPVGRPRAFAVFAHCFTCTKEVHAVRRVALGLNRHGIGVLRFDFSGLGESEGDFANAGFTGNVEDLKAAVRALEERGHPPALLVGHSWGGAAALAAAGDLPTVRAVATIGAPFDPAHVLKHFGDALEALEEGESATVSVGGRPFRLSRRFLEDVMSQRQEERIRALRRPLLILHGPTDDVVGIENAEAIYRTARHPKSLVSLDGADHLLRRREDARYAAEVIAAWATRHLPELLDPELVSPFVEDATHVIVAESGTGRYQEVISAKGHRMLADEPEAAGGRNEGPDPYGLLLAALGACTAMTVRMYAERKDWPLEHVAVRLAHRRIHADDCADCATKEGTVDEISREIAIRAPRLDARQRTRLLEIAEKCPVHRTLVGEVKIRPRAAASAPREADPQEERKA